MNDLDQGKISRILGSTFEPVEGDGVSQWLRHKNTPPPEEPVPKPRKIKRYPIATAERDGTSVMLWFKGYANSVEGYYENGKWIQAVNGCEITIEPTHWSPIPVPIDEELKS